jgi:transposase
MLTLPSLGEMDRGLSAKVYLATAPTDMRKGFDTLAAMVKQFLKHDPLSGHLFLFVGRGKDRLKILYWDSDGFAIWYKRLEEGTFRLPAVKSDAASVQLKASELAMLLEGIDLKSIKRSKRFALAEKLDPNQLALFTDLLKKLEAAEPEPLATVPPEVRCPRKGHSRRKLPADLPREKIVHDLPEAQKPCPCCGEMRQLIGQETSEQLDYEPAKVKIIEHVRLKYACRACEAKAAEGGPQIAVATKPPSPIEKGLAAAGLLAYVTVSRFADHLPYYRLEHILARHGIQIARSTLGDWERQVAMALAPLHERMTQRLLASRMLHTDDTPVDVLEPGRGKTRTGRFWVYVGDDDHPYIVFDYTPNGGPVLPKSPMGAAITYALNQWAALTVYLLDGNLKIDNNTAENAVRRIALGRKNWLFCGSDSGGRTAAVLFSLVATCQRHGVNAFDYFRDVLASIAELPFSRVDELLPDHWQAARQATAATA